MQAFSKRSISWTMSTRAWYSNWTIPRKLWKCKSFNHTVQKFDCKKNIQSDL